MNVRRLDLAAAVLALTAALGMVSGIARADIIYNLDTVTTNNQLFNSPGWGTVAYNDNGNNVNIVIDLTGTGEKVQEFFFNYDPVKFGSSTAFVISSTACGGTCNYQNSENGVQADGYSSGKFDIDIPQSGNLGFAPVTLTISLASMNLNPEDFDFKDTSDQLYNAVHIGNCASVNGTFGRSVCDTPGTNGEQSVFVGSSTHGGGGGGGQTEVPEPATLVLLGSALAGFGIRVRRRRTA